MKKFVVLAVIAMLAFVASVADAQPKIRVGGAVLFDPTQWGGGAGVDIPMSDKPYGLTIQGEYYKKSGVTTVPIRGMAMYKAPAGEQADFYLAAGSGIIYTDTAIGSSTKALGTAVAGLNFKASESFGIFGEVGFDRALTSGAKNNFGVRAGISFGAGE